MLALPPAIGAGVGEVDDGGVAVLRGGRRGAVRQADEVAPPERLAVRGGVAVNVGVLPERELHPALAQPLDEALRVGEGLVVPDEVAGVEEVLLSLLHPERVQVGDIERDAELPEPGDHLFHLGTVPVHAARHPDAEGPQRGHRRSTCQVCVAGQDVLWAGAVDEEVVQVGVLHPEGPRFGRGQAELVDRPGGLVDEDAVAAAAHEEGGVVVGDVRGVGAVGVAAPGDVPLPALVQGPVVLAEAEEVLVGGQREALVEGDAALGVAREAGRQGHVEDDGAVLHLLLVDRLAGGVLDGHPPGLAPDGHPQGAAAEGDGLLAGGDLEGHRWPPLLHQHGCAPRRRLREEGLHAQDLRCDEGQGHGHRLAVVGQGVEAQAGAGATEGAALAQGLVVAVGVGEDGHPLVAQADQGAVGLGHALLLAAGCCRASKT